MVGFFSGQLPKLPNTKLVDVATRLFRSAKIVNTLKPTEKFLDFLSTPLKSRLRYSDG